MAQNQSAQTDLAQQNVGPDHGAETANAGEPDAVNDSLLALLATTRRGRAFLDYHAQRVRHADIASALEMLARIERHLIGTAVPSSLAADAHGPNEAERTMAEQQSPAVLPINELTPPASAVSAAELLAQVKALTPDERIALFS